MSVLNEQGFIEGRYVPILDGKPVASGVSESAVTEASLPTGASETEEEKSKDVDGDGDGGSGKVLPAERASAN